VNFVSRPGPEHEPAGANAADAPKNKFALVAIVKNEARYLLEWLAFYDCIGVEHFVIFDNQSTDDTRHVLESYAQLADLEIIDWPTEEGLSPQIAAYNYFLKNYREKFEFAAFFDADEFLVPAPGLDFKDFLNRIPGSLGAIGFNQRVFGSGGALHYSPDLVLRRFSKCAEPDYDENKYYKSMYRLRNIEAIDNVHASPLQSGDYAFPDFSPLQPDAEKPGKSLQIHNSNFQLHHYILKSREEYQAKQHRGGGAGPTLELRKSRYSEGFFTGRDAKINGSSSSQADVWIPKIIEKLLNLKENFVRAGGTDYVSLFYADMPGCSPANTKARARNAPILLGELMFRQSGADIFAGPPGFHRLTIGDFSPKPEPLVKIPFLHEEPWAAAFHSRREPVHDLGIYTGIDITVVDDGYLFAEGVPVFQSDVVVPYISSYAARQVAKPLIEETRPVIVAYDRGFSTYGHFLIDVLPRLLIAERMLGEDFGGALILLPHRIPIWGKEIFDLIFPNARLVTFDSKKFSLRLRRAILPTHCHKYYMFHPFSETLFKALRARAEPVAPPKPADFLFLSRAGIASNRRTEDFDEIETYAASLGATILRPEAASWREQIGYFAAAKLVIGEYGSALHNTIFANDGVRTLAINRLQFLQSFLGALNRQRLTYVLPASVKTVNGAENIVFDKDTIKKSLDFVVKTELGS